MDIVNLIQNWLEHHGSYTASDYLLLAIWGAFAGLSWSQLTRQRLVLPRVKPDGLQVQLGFLGTLIVAVFVAMVIDYQPVLAGAGTFAIFILADWVYQRRRKSGDPIQDLLTIHQDNLCKLRLTAAKYGMNVPLDLQNAIEYETTEIQRLTEERDGRTG